MCILGTFGFQFRDDSMTRYGYLELNTIRKPPKGNIDWHIIYRFGTDPESRKEPPLHRRMMDMIRKASILIILLLAALSSAHPWEAKGIVTRIIDGATFEVGGFGCVKLADIRSAPAESLAGVKAREFTRDNLANTQVFLDIDNLTLGNDSDCRPCVVYKAYPNGTPNLNANYNRIFAESGFGTIVDDPHNEFDPASWGSLT